MGLKQIGYEVILSVRLQGLVLIHICKYIFTSFFSDSLNQSSQNSRSYKHAHLSL
jgi:hypothetical protein